MSEIKINPSLSSKFKKTQVNSVQILADITGLTIDKFHVDSRLDIVSGEADIYLCSRVNDKSGKSFLLKYYRRKNAVKTDVIKKLKTVNSPYVAKVEGFGEFEGHQYVVRPYYEMSALSELLAEGTRFSEEELKNLIIPSIIEGLRAVHDAGILHKDLKPANIIPDDNREHIVLIDFGISSDAGKNTFVVTETGMTPFYAAPEAMQGIFHRETDYYALGITIFELFTGFTPFQNPGMSGEEAARLAAVSKIEFPENFPESLRKLVLGLTYKDISHRNEKDNPNRRWGYDEVKRWLRGEKVPVPGESSADVNTASAAVPAFPPYRFNGTTCRTEDELIKALLANPEQGIRDLGRGVLTHHYFTINEKKGKLCEKAEKLIEHSEDKVRDFVDFLFKLAPGSSGFGMAVFGKREYEFKNAEAFLNYIDGLAREGRYYEIRHLFRSYGNTLKIISAKFWPSDTYRRLEEMAVPIIQFGDHIFRDDKAFAEYLNRKIAANENTPLNLKNFVAEHEVALSKLKERPALAAVISRLMKFGKLREPENAVITVNGIKFSATNSIRKLTLPGKLFGFISSVNPMNKGGFIKSFLGKLFIVSVIFGFWLLAVMFIAGVMNQTELNSIMRPLISDVKVGSIVTFGRYPQTASGEIKPIEWRVLEVKDNKALLLADKGLDTVPYNTVWQQVTWKTSSIRQWLNTNFYNAAFNDSEKSRIVVTVLKNPDNPKYGTDGGGDTSDRIFLLSLDEAERFFKHDADRVLNPMPHVVKRGVRVNEKLQPFFWWLRSPGINQYDASIVDTSGALDTFGLSVDGSNYAVRPALWVNL